MIATPLPAEGLLRAREQGARLHPLDRALLLLRLADPDALQDPAELPLAERDARLLALRRASLGDDLPCTSHCPNCGELTEFSLSTLALQAGLGRSPEPEWIEADGWRVLLRTLDSRDLATVARFARATDGGTDGADDRALDEAAQQLVQRALARIERIEGDSGAPAQLRHANAAQQLRAADLPAGLPSDLPSELWARAEARVAEREAAADIAIDLQCPACAHRWTDGLDVGAHLWLELDAMAQRLLHEVVALARLFGWSERDILAMPSARRQAYLQAAGGAA